MANHEKLSFDELLEQALVKDEETPYEVPENWLWTRLKYVSSKITDGSHNPPPNSIEGIPILSAKNIFEYSIDFESANRWITEQQWEIENKRTHIEANDVLLTIVGSIGRTAVVKDTKFALQRSVAVIKPLLTSSKYLSFYLSSPYMSSFLNQNAKGTAQKGFYLGALSLLHLPLPPIPEQQRIVDLIESLFEKLDRANELVQEALNSFEERKSAILYKAFTGELTATWREVHSLTPVKCILNDMEEERYSLQKNQSTNNNFSYKKSAQIEIQGRTKGITKLFELPKTWEWVSLGQVTWSVSDGPHFSPKYVDKEVGVPIISARNVKYKYIDFDDAKYVSNEDYLVFIKRGKPEIGDVILTKGGTTGIATTVDSDREFCIWVHIALLKVIRKYVSPEYIRDVLASVILYRQSQEQTHGVGNQDLGLTRMIYMALPLPPLAEQKEIVRILDNLLESEHRAKELYDVIESIDLMKKSILARAFRGELSTNNPDEESALELLKEVLRERVKG